MRGAVAYTDGSCLGNPGPGGWGIRLLYPDGKVEEFGAAVPHTTNNQMELQAAIAALERLGHLSHLTVYTDSRYVIDGLTKWLANWRRRGWKTATGEAVKNRALWQQLAQLTHPDIHWHHVRGHRGNPNNERVDDIARTFASGQTPQLFCGRLGEPEDPVQDVVTPRAVHAGRVAARRPSSRFPKPQYVSIIRGDVVMDHDWPSCEARVRGVAGAKYKKVRTPAELAEFCAKHGVTAP
jgi:ribonuclease HI